MFSDVLTPSRHFLFGHGELRLSNVGANAKSLALVISFFVDAWAMSRLTHTWTTFVLVVTFWRQHVCVGVFVCVFAIENVFADIFHGR